jgi:hypothetical protein
MISMIFRALGAKVRTEAFLLLIAANDVYDNDHR